MLKNFVKTSLSPDHIRALRRFLGPPARAAEATIFGGRVREWLLIKLLESYYSSLLRRFHLFSEESPHFTTQRIGFFQFGLGDGGHGYEPFIRGFLSAELVQPGDRVLDIGCGDGFFTRRFLSPGCERVDAVDIEPSAISTASRYNSAPNIEYRLLDATEAPFPSPEYHVIVWDGALGHFAPETTHRMLGKIRSAIAEGGVFVGSESLGHEGADHLQFFDSIDDLGRLFKQYFKYVEIRTKTYRLTEGYVRTEAFWRCAEDSARLDSIRWKRFD